jgi:hypothetical protein
MGDMTLDTLVRELRDVFGATLRTVALYGAAAGDEPVSRAELYTLVVVDSLPLERLEEGGAHMDAWVRAGHPPPLVLTLAEWRSSADVFPVEYTDILSRHRVLHGALPAEGVAVEPEDLRLAVEREAVGALLQLRRGVLAAGSEPSRRADLLAASFGALVTIFRGALRVHGVQPPSDAADACRELGFRAGVDTAPFLRVLAHRRGAAPIGAGEVHDVLAGYLAGLERLVAHLDQVRPAGGPVS